MIGEGKRGGIRVYFRHIFFKVANQELCVSLFYVLFYLLILIKMFYREI